MLKQTKSLQMFKCCLQQISLGPLLNTLSHISFKSQYSGLPAIVAPNKRFTKGLVNSLKFFFFLRYPPTLQIQILTHAVTNIPTPSLGLFFVDEPVPFKFPN